MWPGALDWTVLGARFMLADFGIGKIEPQGQENKEADQARRRRPADEGVD